jgi:aminoglycoside phosphotransferase (APT) family kinase protein
MLAALAQAMGLMASAKFIDHLMLNQEEIERLARFLLPVLGASHIHVTHVRRFHGGASRETYGLDLTADGKPLGLIVRRDPADSLIDTERSLEFAAYRSFEQSSLPVPKALCLCEDPAVIGSPFFVMERIDGGQAESAFNAEAYGEHRTTIGQQFFTHLGSIASVDAASSPLAKVVPMPDAATVAKAQLDHWEAIIAADAMEPQPIVAAAIRWLKRTMPPPPQRLAIVHGDYRNGNVLHDTQGKIIAVLDWEMAHIGDAHEDLAWALDPMWNLQDTSGRAAGLIPLPDAIALWETASGLRLDVEAFRWWEMFATVKGIGIWLSAARAFVSGSNDDPILGLSGIFPLAKANLTLANRMGGMP